jgi:hypothetical protein
MATAATSASFALPRDPLTKITGKPDFAVNPKWQKSWWACRKGNPGCFACAPVTKRRGCAAPKSLTEKPRAGAYEKTSDLASVPGPRDGTMRASDPTLDASSKLIFHLGHYLW